MREDDGSVFSLVYPSPYGGDWEHQFWGDITDDEAVSVSTEYLIRQGAAQGSLAVLGRNGSYRHIANIDTGRSGRIFSEVR